MKIQQLPVILEKIVNSIESVTGTTLNYAVYPKNDDATYPGIDAATFPYKVDNIIGEDRNGLYLFSSKVDGQTHYVGISTDVVSRFYQHIGKGFSWSTNGQAAKFPNCTLVSDRPWLDKKIKDLFENAEFIVTFIIPDRKDSKELIEKYLIYYGLATQDRFSINVPL